ncbi:hypothetical protein LWI29_014201 [Acer saccharum]|uniref:Uncharacterized protein n=1 Tax=Acer saccharum TaxID=4024 RepID=A0AA39TFX3_ACESA|nr:hypothetical protein LWI29_014201 [Acer saccharum]
MLSPKYQDSKNRNARYPDSPVLSTKYQDSIHMEMPGSIRLGARIACAGLPCLGCCGWWWWLDLGMVMGGFVVRRGGSVEQRRGSWWVRRGKRRLGEVAVGSSEQRRLVGGLSDLNGFGVDWV